VRVVACTVKGGIQFFNLCVILPNQTVASVKHELAHVVYIAALARF
jgi:hypothetical protein